MKRSKLTDWAIKKKIGLDDITNPTDEQLKSLADMSLGTDLSDGLIQNVLDKCSNISHVASVFFSEYKQLAVRGIESNDESIRFFNQSCADTIKAFEEELNKEEKSETRAEIRKDIMQVLQMMRESTTENKHFISDWLSSHRTTVFKILEWIGSITFMGLVYFLGIKPHFHRGNSISIGSNISSIDDDDDDDLINT